MSAKQLQPRKKSEKSTRRKTPGRREKQQIVFKVMIINQKEQKYMCARLNKQYFPLLIATTPLVSSPCDWSRPIRSNYGFHAHTCSGSRVYTEPVWLGYHCHIVGFWGSKYTQTPPSSLHLPISDPQCTQSAGSTDIYTSGPCRDDPTCLRLCLQPPPPPGTPTCPRGTSETRILHIVDKAKAPLLRYVGYTCFSVSNVSLPGGKNKHTDWASLKASKLKGNPVLLHSLFILSSTRC